MNILNINTTMYYTTLVPKWHICNILKQISICKQFGFRVLWLFIWAKLHTKFVLVLTAVRLCHQMQNEMFNLFCTFSMTTGDSPLFVGVNVIKSLLVRGNIISWIPSTLKPIPANCLMNTTGKLHRKRTQWKVLSPSCLIIDVTVQLLLVFTLYMCYNK